MYGPAPRRGPKTPSEWAILTGFLLVFLALFVVGIAGDFRPANLTAPLVLLFWIPLLALHEGGHAAAAALLGWRVGRVVVGVGASIGRRMSMPWTSAPSAGWRGMTVMLMAANGSLLA